MKILVCAKHYAELIWLRRSLRERGLKVHSAHDGFWAMRMYTDFRPFDVVITDLAFRPRWTAPGKMILDGLDLIAAIRSIDPLQSFIIQLADENLTPPLGVPVLYKPLKIHKLMRLLEEPVQPSLPL